MASLKEVRLANLFVLIEREKSVAELARKTDTDPIYLRQLKDRVPDSKTGRPRQMGNKIAAKIEIAYGWEPGTMDRPLPNSMPIATAPLELGTFAQLEADWLALPAGWQFHLCRKARQLREWSDEMPVFVRDSIKPIQDDSEYHTWEKSLEQSLADKEQRDEDHALERGNRAKPRRVRGQS